MRYFTLFALASVLLCCSCEQEQVESVSQLVIEGWIENEEAPVIILTRNIPISSEYKAVSDLEQYIIKWAKVTISDGEHSVILTGMYDSDYFPPYVYTTGYMAGEVGKSYTLEVEYKNFHASATTTIPAVTAIEQIRAETCKQSDTLYTLRLQFRNPPEPHQYYTFKARTNSGLSNYHTAWLCVFDGGLLPPQPEVEVHKELTSHVREFSPYFQRGDTVDVKFCTMDSMSYNFWHDFVASTSLSRNPLFPVVQNLRTNVHGAIGYWCGYGVTKTHVVVGAE